MGQALDRRHPDTPWGLGAGHPSATARDIDYLLDQANRVLRDTLTREDVVGVYAGLRPLLQAAGDDPARLSREHAVEHAAPGLVVVAGGKYTTYRVMAHDAVDAAVAGAERVPASCTDRVPLLGADGFEAMRNRAGALAESSTVPVEHVTHLLGRYGSLTADLLDLIRERPDLATPLANAPDYLRVEVWYAALAEGALHLDDVLRRRTRIAIETRDRGMAAAEEAAALMGEVLGWSSTQTADEVVRYTASVHADLELEAQLEERLVGV